MKKIFCEVLIVSLLFSNVWAFYDDMPEEGDEGVYIETVSETGVPNLNAKAAILYDVTYDRILYEKNAKQRRANASTTKMITALVAMEKGNLKDIIEVSQNAASIGGSTIKLKKGDKISLEDLLKGLLIHSGNDAAVCIAEYIAGGVDNFAVLMNKKAEELGAVDTHFVTPHGLDEDDHYSTAFDLALISKEILKNTFLSHIVAQQSAQIVVNNQERTVTTTNEMLSFYEGANGIKTRIYW